MFCFSWMSYEGMTWKIFVRICAREILLIIFPSYPDENITAMYSSFQ